MKLLKHSLRIIISALLGFWIIKYIEFDAFLNILMFFLIYIIVSFILEFIFNKIKPVDNGDKSSKTF